MHISIYAVSQLIGLRTVVCKNGFERRLGVRGRLVEAPVELHARTPDPECLSAIELKHLYIA